MNEIKQFYDECAQKHGADPEATCPDSYYREVEIRNVLKHLKGDRILDVGCGNGYSTIRYKLIHPGAYVGVDYSNEMLEVARKADPNIIWVHGDILDRGSIPFDYPSYDTVVSCRCIINLQTWDEQRQAIENMLWHVKPGGRLILVENFLDGLKKLNALRIQFGLDPIAVRWHNRYLLMEEFHDWVHSQSAAGVSHYANIGGLYYLLSRVVYATLCKQQGTEPDYGHSINEIASRMPDIEMPYSANYLIVLEKAS